MGGAIYRKCRRSVGYGGGRKKDSPCTHASFIPACLPFSPILQNKGDSPVILYWNIPFLEQIAFNGYIFLFRGIFLIKQIKISDCIENEVQTEVSKQMLEEWGCA